MARKNLKTLVDVAELDRGGVGLAFAHELARVVADCDDRPAVDVARTVTLKASLKPVPSDQGTLHTVKVEFEVSSKLPVRRSCELDMIHGSEGTLWHNPLSPDDAKQATIDEEITKQD